MLRTGKFAVFHTRLNVAKNETSRALRARDDASCHHVMLKHIRRQLIGRRKKELKRYELEDWYSRCCWRFGTVTLSALFLAASFP